MSNKAIIVREQGTTTVITRGTQGPAGAAGGGSILPPTTTPGLNLISGPSGSIATGPLPRDGRDGDPGARGDQGDPGPRGATGATGATGAEGDQGDVGPRGAQGDTGPRGNTGATGARGADGFSPQVLRYQFLASTTAGTGGFPSLGYFALNHVDPAMADRFQLSNHDLLIHDDAPEIAQWDDSTSTIKGKLYIGRVSDNDTVAYNLIERTGTTGVAEFEVDYIGGNFSPALTADEQVFIAFIPKGDKGDTGAAGRDGRDGTGTGSSDIRGYATLAARNAAGNVPDNVIAIVADVGNGSPGHFYRSGGQWRTGAGGERGATGASVSLPYALDGNRSVPATGNIDGRLFINTAENIIDIALLDSDGQNRAPYFTQKFGGTSDIKGFLEIEDRNPNTGAAQGSFSMSVANVAVGSRTIRITQASGTTNASSGTGLGGSGSTLAVFTTAKGDKGDTGLRGAKGDKGDQGDQGDTGPRGAQGETGETGARGAQGNTGATGEQGDPGPRGARGEPGQDATLSNTSLASYGGVIQTTGAGAQGRIGTLGAGADVHVARGNIGANRTAGAAPSATEGNIAAEGYIQKGSFTTAQRSLQSSGCHENGRSWYNSTLNIFEGYANGQFVPFGGIVVSGTVAPGTLIARNSANDAWVALAASALPFLAAADLRVNPSPQTPSGTGRIAYDSATTTITYTPPVIPDVSNFRNINVATGTTGQLNVVAQVGGNLQLTGLLEHFVGTATESPTGSVLSIVNRGSNAQDRQYGFRPAASGGGGVRKEIVMAFNNDVPGNGGLVGAARTTPKRIALPVVGGVQRTLGDYTHLYVKLRLGMHRRTSNVSNYIQWLAIDVFNLINDPSTDFVSFDSIAAGGPNGHSFIIQPSASLATSTAVAVNLTAVNDASAINEGFPDWRIQGATGQLV